MPEEYSIPKPQPLKKKPGCAVMGWVLSAIMTHWLTTNSTMPQYMRIRLAFLLRGPKNSVDTSAMGTTSTVMPLPQVDSSGYRT
ncbi:hypothetical protein [Corynebacterium durum]|uniref:Uncharacterized protein n=1 Tax=Corynebacterium durum F0235 TaxID=1035195 RepID=L1MK82_9CORY|nr:hypothetical protein [Corynebacterium durum]EKX91698.1 hypothetical protein HMPREF9997_00539 [Corynebacterium durum F0235]MDO4651310.1 hypothetical protein [Corynebacterium durum]